MANTGGKGKRLNKEQLEAIKHKKGPLLIIAGAGTGKTTVITERIKYLILSKLAKTSEILALTFTEKAAREMEERVDVTMPYGYTSMWILTFHSFCDRILRQEALHIGLDPRYKLMSVAETVQFVRTNLFKFDLKYFRPLGNPTKFVGGMLQHFSRLQDEDIMPSRYAGWAQTQKSKLKSSRKAAQRGKQKDKSKLKIERQEIAKWGELARAFKVYDELKVKEGVMDFGDLIIKTLALFRQRPNVLREYRKQFKHILVDEYQDTNIAQNELVKLLAGRAANITVVLDDDQSIYRFRGAAISNALQFRKTFPKTKIVTLIKNYRSAQEILDKAYDLIQHNNPYRLESIEKIDKKLVAQRKDVKADIEFVHVDRVENEAEEVAKKINELVGSSTSDGARPSQTGQGRLKSRRHSSEVKKAKVENQLSYGDIAILVRANNHSEPFIRALSRYGIPYQFLGPGRLYRQPEVIDMISYLKVLCNFEDSVALYRILSQEHFDIPARDLARVGNYARRFNFSLFEACEKADDIFISKETRKKIKKTLKTIDKHLKLVRRETAGQLLYYYLEDTGLLQKLLGPDNPEAEKRAMNVSKFFDKLKTYEVDHQDATVSAVVGWLELSSELGESPLAADIDWTEIDAVNILTAHSAKGLEFPVVFLVNLVSQRFPTVHRREQIPIPESLIKEVLPIGDYHVQEERRLFYVGMTRTKDRLFFTAANYYGEGKREKRLSPFIFEALGDDAVASEQSTESQQLSFLDYKPKAKPSEVLTKEGQPLPIHIDYLSYSQIETFRICPLHYKLKYIYKIPTPPSAAQSFGNSMHTALKDFYLLLRGGKRPSEKLLLKSLKENWISEGYTSKDYEKKMFERGRNYLSGFLKKEFDPKKIPIALEQPFVVPLSPPKADLPKAKQLGGRRRLKIGGKIDRVDALPNGGIEIIDYKTGANVPTQKQVDHDLQLALYALAATNVKEAPFNKKPKDVVLTLYYFDNQERISTKRTREQLGKAKEEILKWREEIEKSDFKCSGSYLCKNCEYSLFCRV